MSPALVVAMMVGAGLLMSFQAPINAALGRGTGVFEAALVSFSVGTIALAAVVLALGTGRFGAAFAAPPWQYLGGLIGAVFVVTTLVAAPRIGVAGLIAAALAGQMLGALLIDRFGWLSMTPRDITPWRLLGVALLGVAVWLINLKESQP